ncbi:hypothetical protein C2E23DRAFT_886014 [Lenzites betulinus]|nr:hypothetical protein C2E23DRAFT_886014 [Lenzites betulinus]
MDASSNELKTCILDWDENDVHNWLSRLGFPQYEQQVKEHNISGDALCLLDPDGLKDMGIATIGQRLTILKAVYNVKLAQNIPIDPEHYVPPSEVEERQEVSVGRLYELLKDQSERLRTLEEDNRRLSDTLSNCLEDLSQLRSSSSRSQLVDSESPVQRSHTFKWGPFVKPAKSPTKTTTDVESPQPSPQRMEHDIHHNPSRQLSSAYTDKPRASGATLVGSEASTSQHPSYLNANTLQPNPAPPRPQRQDSQDNLKSFKVSLDDPAWKVLPAALKKYKINNDDWQNYAMFICYGAPGSRIERCLSYDEKPLLLFQKLKDAKKNPVFMLKHIKDIRSPIAVAQQKQAARKASATEGGSAKSTSTPGPSANSHSQGQHLGQSPSQDGRGRPPKLQVNSQLPNPAPGLLTSVPNAQSGWPELMSPMVEKGDPHADASKGQGDPGPAGNAEVADGGTPPILREMPPASEVSYAVAIYPYMAEQEDEFDVVVGDTFIIVSRARGWWVVQRDPAGSGQVEQDVSMQGWVPAGCLLETKVPVATAIAEATARGGMAGSPPPSPPGTTPILPLSILSTSFPGIALMDYKKKGEEELDLQKDDSLRVFKRYNHWSYAVKEESGDRGWVPSWFIGKVPSSGGTPATPSVSNAPNLSVTDQDSRYADLTASQQAQVSPMSSAFPPIQSRT